MPNDENEHISTGSALKRDLNKMTRKRLSWVQKLPTSQAI